MRVFENVSFPFRIFSKQENKHRHISLSSCYCQLFVTASFCRQHDASFSQSKTFIQIQNLHGSLNRSRFSFLRILITICFLISTRNYRIGSWSWEFNNWKKTSAFGKYEISFLLYLVGFGVKRHSMRNIKRGELLSNFSCFEPVEKHKIQFYFL